MKNEEELCKRLEAVEKAIVSIQGCLDKLTEVVTDMVQKQTYIQSTIHKELCDVKNEIAKIPDIVAGRLKCTKPYVYNSNEAMAMEG